MIHTVMLLMAALTAAGPVPGSGPIAVTMETQADLPGFTVYRPSRPAQVKRRMPIVAFANGGCLNLGNSAAPLLGEIASHGYLVVAIGPIGSMPEVREHEAETGTAQERLARQVANSRPAPTSPAQLSQAIDWALSADRKGVLAGRVATDKVALAGHSCGGLQAIAAAAIDPRVDTTIALNSGVFPQPAVKVDKSALDRLRGPIAYFIGGPQDIAFANAEDDFAHITKVPVLKANNGFGHGGRLTDPNGGPTAVWVVRWLDWQLKESVPASRAFLGEGCELCATPGWTVTRKGF